MSTPTFTKALTLPEVASPLHLTLPSVPVPNPPPPGTCNVRILATQLNAHFPSLMTGAVKYLTFPTPFVPGSSAIGRVLSTGPDATLLKPGDLVWVDCFVRSRDDPATTQILMGLHSGPTEAQIKLMQNGWPNGLYKTIATAPLENTYRLDESALGRLQYTLPELAISLDRFAVAYGGISAVDLKAGQTFIVGPATGHFSGAAVELGVALGARVIALSRNASALEHLRATVSSTYPGSPPLATVVISGDAAADEAAIRSKLPAGSAGADAFLDISPGLGVQPAHIPTAIACLRPGGKVALMGGVYGNLDVNYAGIMFRNISIKGQWMYSKEEAGQMLRMVEAGVAKVGKAAGYEVCGEYALEEWEAAVDGLEGSEAWGKGVVFVPRDE
ncbi:related to ADH3 - alcohol dehydrogenase III [Cephalotrichum gorgonifer]|uniref:Related to ADH3 - alcohol dehydrogenase III n=1 Tax=Cephalotrichum gorgonifer TaxID=2041049 RepID=A0AAE8MY53_9PEZI|nr:related to ADH3 - alcohol dehydrogenase III [Cephalotrichum gorgonifer]